MDRRPLDSYQLVMAGLARVSGRATWGYGDILSRRGVDANQLSSARLLRPALALESTMRDIVLGVIGIAAREAEAHESVWLDLTTTIRQDAERRAIERIRDGVRRLGAEDPMPLLEARDDEPEEANSGDAVEAWLRTSLDAAMAMIDQVRDALDSAKNAAAPHDSTQPSRPGRTLPARDSAWSAQ